MNDILLGLAMLAAFALIGTGFWMLAKRVGTKLKAWLMIAAGTVTIFNVYLSTLPVTQTIEVAR